MVLVPALLVYRPHRGCVNRAGTGACPYDWASTLLFQFGDGGDGLALPGAAWVEVHDAVVLGAGIGKPAQEGVGFAQVEVEAGAVGDGFYGVFEGGDGFLGLVALDEGPAHRVE